MKVNLKGLSSEDQGKPSSSSGNGGVKLPTPDNAKAPLAEIDNA
jgi:hypothetical protein